MIGKMKESVEVSVQLEKEDVKKASSIVRREAPLVRCSRSVSFAVAAVIGITVGLTRSGYAAIALLSALVTIGILGLTIRAVTKRQMNKVLNESKVWHSPYTVSLSSDGVKTTSIHSKSENTWEGYKKVVETEQYFVLIHPTRAFLILPKRGFGDDKVELAREIFRGAMGENFLAKI
jgi:hypothetical protein